METDMTPAIIERNYAEACRRYAALGVDSEAALARLAEVDISLHCWQGDDVRGFEVHEGAVDGGGILATGNYPGAARTGEELRADAAAAFALIPGKLRFNLHAIYAETDGRRIPRDELTAKHFRHWIDWAKANHIQLDFNPTFFAHPLAADGYTLSHPDDAVRQFWIRHAVACRRIAEAMGQALGGPCHINHWIPDGAKDHPLDRWSPRQRLVQSLDAILAEDVDRRYCQDSVECKLFGIGSEDYVVGSHEFYLGYAARHPVRLCLDMGHFHPTETIRDKLSAVITFEDDVLLHVSRGIRWDSDHVVILNDDLRDVFSELVRGKALKRARIALDFFDASMNRIGAWTIGTRATQKAILLALLEPGERLRDMERAGNQAGKLAMLEELKTHPFGAVWDMHCQRAGVPVGTAWIEAMQQYDREVTRMREA